MGKSFNTVQKLYLRTASSKFTRESTRAKNHLAAQFVKRSSLESLTFKNTLQFTPEISHGVAHNAQKSLLGDQDGTAT